MASVMDQYRLQQPSAPPSGTGDIFSAGLKGGVSGAGTGAAASGGNPYVAAGAAIVGTGMGVWQALKNQDANDAAYESQMKAYQQNQADIRQARQDQEKAQDVSNVASGAQFAGSLQDDILNKYQQYYKNIGK